MLLKCLKQVTKELVEYHLTHAQYQDKEEVEQELLINSEVMESDEALEIIRRTPEEE